jgi:hypothetical protein
MTVTNSMATTTAKDAYKAKIKEYKHLTTFQHTSSMTAAGFKRIATRKVSQKVQRYWSKNKGGEKKSSQLATTTNHWSFRSTGGLDESSLRGSSIQIDEGIHHRNHQRTLGKLDWRETRLSSSPPAFIIPSGATVSPHATHHSRASAIINVAQDLNEAWPMEIINDGVTRQVTLLPGDALIETSSIIQGYPHLQESTPPWGVR